MVKIKCRDCEEEKEIGKDIFFCPLIINMNYDACGDYICTKCCQKNFMENIHAWNRGESVCGSCHQCDFPIGALLFAQSWVGEPEHPDYIVFERRAMKPIGGKSKGFTAERTGDFQVNIFDHNKWYYGFQWNHKSRTLELKPKEIYDGYGELFFQKKKLPTRIIMTMNRALSSTSLQWQDYLSYYWAKTGHPQHFKEEKWMDESPVIITNLYCKTNMCKMDHNVQADADEILKDIKRKGSLYVLEHKGDE